MPRTCTVCIHPERAAINKALIANEPFRHIAGRFGTSATALTRHKAEHLPAIMVKSQAAKETALAGDLFSQVQQLRDKAAAILDAAEQAGDLRTALLGIREARACVELLAEMEGELHRNPTINILLAPQWIELRAVLLQALAPFPEARAATAAALLQMEADSGDG